MEQSSRNEGIETEEEISSQNSETRHESPLPWSRRCKWWIQMAVFTFFVLGGKSAGTILTRFYFTNGGKSKLMGTLVQVVGYPVLIPLQWMTASKQPDFEPSRKNPRVRIILVLIYITFGIFIALTSMLYTIGLQYLPVTTYTLISASQLGFNAIFAIFINKQKITPYILNSVVVLTVSSTILVFETDPGDSHKTTKAKYVIGFVSTLAASAGYALTLSATQLAFQKIIQHETFRAVLDLSVYEAVVATFVILIGLFATGEWRTLNMEMNDFKTGRVSYIMNLFWTAVSWQAFNVGSIGLIFKISSLFANVMSILGMPLVSFLSLIFLHDKLTGLKAIAMVLTIWGFVSYAYQNYLDEKTKVKESPGEVSEATSSHLQLS